MNVALEKLVMKNRRIRFAEVRAEGKLLASLPTWLGDDRAVDRLNQQRGTSRRFRATPFVFAAGLVVYWLPIWRKRRNGSFYPSRLARVSPRVLNRFNTSCESKSLKL
jgi:hypothetical protein